jgi:purine-cytosine permease-like protein
MSEGPLARAQARPGECEREPASGDCAREPASDEYERERVPEHRTKGFLSFVGMFAGEHVAGTELLIGPLFVVHGVTAFDLLGGLFVGNVLAVLTWTFVTAPIAVRHRLTLYFHLEKIGGASLVKVYNVANGALWCSIAAAMIYVSATAVAWPLGFAMPGLSDWLPPGPGLALSVIATGLLFTYIAARGYDAVARFANVVAPWMVVMFLIFGIASLPELGVRSLADFWRAANDSIWPGQAQADRTRFTFWHVMFFSWFGNMAWHWGMGDLSIFRFARKSSYGLASAAGMFLGHYLAWVCAGLLYAVQLRQNLADNSVNPGPLAFRVGGWSGILLVLVAGWTTANPIIYRAGLAFQSLRPRWSRFRVTLAAGVAASLIGIFPGLCSEFLNVAALYGLALCPMGAVIFADHYLARRLGLCDLYAERAGLRSWWPPLAAWALALVACVLLNVYGGVQVFFLGLPGWLAAGTLFLALSAVAQKRRAVAQGCRDAAGAMP